MTRHSQKWSGRRTLVFVVVTSSMLWAALVASAGLIVELARG